MGLDLYAKIEPYLDFEEEVYKLHKEFMAFVMQNNMDTILDIGCGQGYFIHNLNVNQKKAFGIDLSAYQIDACKQKGIENVACVALDEVTEKFDCATAIFDVINYIPFKDLSQFFKDTHTVLNPKGYFIFDVNSLFGFEEIAQGCITMDFEDKFIAIDAVYEEEKLTTQLTLFTQNNELYEKEQDCITQYYHKEKELKKLLEKSNFKVIEIKKFHLHSEDAYDKQIFICQKISS